MKKTLSFALISMMLFQIFSFGTPAAELSRAESRLAKSSDTLPSSFTLIGTPDLPPICNQGEIGCCASAAITYMQFTNAVSRYIREYEPDKVFEPSTGELRYIFSPKWTYALSGAGTAWVYNILVQQGCVTFDKSKFVIFPFYKYFQFHDVENSRLIDSSAIKWDIDGTQMEEALNYRLSSYEQIWINDDYKVDGKVRITSTEKGQQLLNKIKKSLNDGNVVVTGGLSTAWKYVNVLTKKGDLAGSLRETALVCSRGPLTGGHQLSIVGYDDNITCKYEGVELKGAFQVANSWGEKWENKGCVWLMYDALNEYSEHEELNFEDRVITMDQFCFVDWRTDIVSGAPQLYAEADVTAADRESVSVTLTRKDAESGMTESESQYMYTYANYHPTYDLLKDGGYLNFNGELNGEASKVTLTHQYGTLLELEEGKSLSDYLYGLNIECSGGEVILHAVRLKNARGEVIAKIDISEGGQKIVGTQSFFFEKPFCRLTVPSSKDSDGYTMEGYSAYYAQGSEVTLDYALKDGYTDEKMGVSVENGEELSRNEEGKFVVKVERDTVLVVSGVERIPDPEPTITSAPVTPTNSGNGTSEPGEETDKGAKLPLAVTISAVAAACVVVVVVAVAVVVHKKKKS